MALEDFCLVSGIGFVLLYAVTLAASWAIVRDYRRRDNALHRIRCPVRRPSR
jgi:hypothetical protein